MLRVATAAFAVLAIAVFSAPGHSQRLSASAVIVRLDGAATGPLLGYEIALRPVDGGLFVSWQDARATDVRRMLLCTSAWPEPACVREPADTRQRIRNITVGYVMPFTTVAGWTASARPQLGWSFAESSATGRTVDMSTAQDRASARLGVAVEFGSRPLLHRNLRLHVGGEAAMALSRREQCLDCSPPPWAGTMSSTSLHLGASLLVR